MIKMIVMDLDGTLLDKHKNISGFNLSILEKCRARGIKIVIATARSEKSAERCIRLVKPDIMILNGGALVINTNRQIIHKKLLSAKTSNLIINECIQSNNIGEVTVETEDGYYVSYKEPANHPDYMHGKYYDFSKPLSQSTYKITVQIFDKETATAIGGKYEECNVLNFSNENWCRFAHREAEKMTAVNKISIHAKIAINEIAAFGDDYNDIEMIKGCGIGIAMENGVDENKKMADYVCKNNNEDGVGNWLEENVL
jgi:Cof subfamily protein (haloacid dehalogenase superfamily)